MAVLPQSHSSGGMERASTYETWFLRGTIKMLVIMVSF